MQSIGERIKFLRVKKGLSHQKLANAVGVSKASVIFWEQNKNIPKHESLIALSIELGTSFDFILTGYDVSFEDVEATNDMSVEELKVHVKSLIKIIKNMKNRDLINTDLADELFDDDFYQDFEKLKIFFEQLQIEADKVQSEQSYPELPF